MTPGTAAAFEGRPRPRSHAVPSIQFVCLALGRGKFTKRSCDKSNRMSRIFRTDNETITPPGENGYSRSAPASDVPSTRRSAAASVSQITGFLWAGPLEMSGFEVDRSPAAPKVARCRGINSIICLTCRRSWNWSRPKRLKQAKEPRPSNRRVTRPGEIDAAILLGPTSDTYRGPNQLPCATSVSGTPRQVSRNTDLPSRQYYLHLAQIRRWFISLFMNRRNSVFAEPKI